MTIRTLCAFMLLALLISHTIEQKLLVVIVEGLGGSQYHKLIQLPGFKAFKESGVWSTRLYPEFPTLQLPNRQTLMTGYLPSKHGFVGDYMYNQRTGQVFHNFESPSDFSDELWWKTEPIYVTAQKAGAPTALFFFPECEVSWEIPLSICEPPLLDGSGLDDLTNVKRIIEATKTHDLVMVNHDGIRKEVQKKGPKNIRYSRSEAIEKFTQALERLQAKVKERIDLNLLVVSPHGYIDVPSENNCILDKFVPMEMINTTIGAGAVKQIVAYAGKTHQIYSQLSRSPIPNVKAYRTAKNVGKIPHWYHYRRSERIPDLVLIATPGHGIYVEDENKQIPPPRLTEMNKGLSGYNNEYPDMLGILLACGPVFQSGMRKGPVNLRDVYELMCVLLRLNCHRSQGNLTNISDVLLNEAYYIDIKISPASFACCHKPVLILPILFVLLRSTHCH